MGYKNTLKGNLNEYQDKNAILEVFGCLLKDPTLLKKYTLRVEDFVDVFHRTLFSVIHNMIREGAKEIKPDQVQAYLKENYPVKYDMFIKHNGAQYMDNAAEFASLDNFEMNYNTVRKWSLLRELVLNNIDVSEYYDPDDIVMGEEAEAKRIKFETDSLDTILSYYKTKIVQISNIFSDMGVRDFKKAGGQESLEQLEAWKQSPNFGLSYASQLLTTVTYGLRRKRMTVTSAPPGVGKTRIAIANMCFSFAPYYWDSKTKKWEPNPHGTENSALYIGTEMELLEEIEPIIWAYMADVPEDHITQNEYAPGEEERVKEAINFLRQTDEQGQEKKCGIYMEYVPEYDTGLLESIIEKYVTLYGVSAVFFDYIYSNPKLLAEYSAAAQGRFAMRDDQALSNLSTKLKDLTRKYNISLDTSTQVSGDYKRSENYDETIVRGAKSIIDKCDIGIILSIPTKKEKEKIEPIVKRSEMISKPAPNICLTVYKNRGGRYGKVKVWLFIDYRTMRVHDLFATNLDYELLKIEKSRVVVDDKGLSHVFTNTDAMQQYKEGLISQDMLTQVISQEKQDPSFNKRTRNDDRLLKQAEFDKAETAFLQPGIENNLTVDDDFDAEDFDY